MEGRVAATRDRSGAIEDAEREAAEQAAAKPASKDLPPALAAMIEDRREQAEAAAETARNAAIVALPANAWREIQQRAATVGISAELADRRRGAADRCRPSRPTSRALTSSGRDDRRARSGPRRVRTDPTLSAVLAVVLLVFFGGTLSAVLEAIGEAIQRAS